MSLEDDLKKDVQNIDMKKVEQYAKENGYKDMELAKQKYMEMKSKENK